MTRRITKAGSAGTSTASASAPAAGPAPASNVAAVVASSTTSTETAALGSSTLPAVMMIGDKEVQLGTIVTAALAASGMTVTVWNELGEEQRDSLLNAQVDAMRHDAAEAAAEAKRQAEEVEAQRLHAEAEEAERLRKEEDARVAAEEGEKARRAKAEVVYPRRVLVTNNGGKSLLEPISGAFIQAGGKASIVFADAEHEQRIGENLAALLEQNNLPDSCLEVEDLPS